MSQSDFTQEFSICLVPDTAVMGDIFSLRQMLPDSPYRDDPPHITLLRGISSTHSMSDDELVHNLQSLLQPSKNLPFQATVKEAANKSNQLYSLSGLLILDAGPQLLAYRSHVAKTLQYNGYTVEAQELQSYTPHITVRLGVPLKSKMLEQAQKLFGGRAITFENWFVLRLVLQDGKRTMHKVSPS